ncbi:MAG: tetratricopeptide repeat protein [Bacteroidetes bacterium]|nr:tetratricopeptide repeat protein [Bacteroidota bacterium]
MKNCLVFLLFLFVTGITTEANGQMTAEEAHTVDSLKKITLSGAHDTIVLSAYLDWDNIIYYYDTELDIELNQKILEITKQGLKKNNITIQEKEAYFGYKGLALNNLGLIYIDYGNYFDALKSLQESLQIAEYFKDSTKQGNCLNNIGMIYKHMDMTDKALEYYDRSLQFTGEDHYSLATYYNNAGICYLDMGNDSMALECYAKSIVHADSCNDNVGKGNTLANIALVYMRDSLYQEALTYLQQAIENYDKVGEQSGLAFAIKNIGVCYLELGDLTKAMDYCSRGLGLATENKSLSAQKESCDCLYRVYKQKGDTKNALRYHELFHVFRDSLQGAEKNEELLKLDFQFNSERQHLADSLEFANAQNIQRLTYETDLHKKEKTQYVLFAGIGILLLAGIFIYRSYYLKKRDAEIIARQKEEVETQKHLVEEKNKEITDSINYAKRIQEAILPGQQVFSKCLPDSFILYKPKDIVAGDFYWLEEVGEKIIFAVADCTGHGVPGAMVSVVCHNALNRSVNEFKLTDPGKILDKTRELVAETFDSTPNQDKLSGTIRDGMDISLCVLNKQTHELKFSGANNSLYLVRDQRLTGITNANIASEKMTAANGHYLMEVKADKQPIGKYADEKPFSTVQLNLQKNDILYLYTDGYADQFGGPDAKKFKYKQLKELLVRNASKNLDQQARMLNESFEKWKGNLEQVDDVCLMGVRI